MRQSKQPYNFKKKFVMINNKMLSLSNGSYNECGFLFLGFSILNFFLLSRERPIHFLILNLKWCIFLPSRKVQFSSFEFLISKVKVKFNVTHLKAKTIIEKFT